MPPRVWWTRRRRRRWRRRRRTVAAATATGRLTRSSSSLGTMVAGRRRPRSPRSSAGGGTSRSGHPSGIRFGWRDNHAATSRRLSQLVYIAALANSWFVSGSRRGPRPRQKVSMASRSYVLPLPATNTGSRIIAFVMGQRSSSGSSSPGWRVGASAVAPSSFASSSASACPRGEVFGEGGSSSGPPASRAERATDGSRPADILLKIRPRPAPNDACASCDPQRRARTRGSLGSVNDDTSARCAIGRPDSRRQIAKSKR